MVCTSLSHKRHFKFTSSTVPIPPREQPFRIGIRAYDIRHPEGSFVMLDNLLYEAQFCRVSSQQLHWQQFIQFSVDFGPNFHTEPLLTAANGEFVQTAAELSCSNFDGNCHWRNLGHGEKGVGIWRVFNFIRIDMAKSNWWATSYYDALQRDRNECRANFASCLLLHWGRRPCTCITTKW